MLAKRVFSLSGILRNLASVSQSNVIYHCQRYEHFKVKSVASQIQNRDDTYDEIKFDKFQIPYAVENLLSMDQKDINGTKIVTALKSLLFMSNKSEAKLKTLHNLSFFKDLCSIIDKNATEQYISDLPNILYFLTQLGLPSNSPLISSLLKQAESNLNTSSMNYFIELSRTISKMNRTAITYKTITNMNKKFLFRLNADYEKDNLDFLCHALHYACKYLQHKSTACLLMDNVKNCGLDSISSTQAIILIKSISMLQKVPDAWYTVIDQVQNKLIDKIDDISIVDLNYLLILMSKKVNLDRNEKFYNSTFCDKIAEQVIKRNVDLNDALFCLTSFNKLLHVNQNLLNYSAALFYEEIEVFKGQRENEINKLLVLLTGLSNMKYKPLFWDTIHKHFLRGGQMSSFNVESQIIYCFHLAAIECYDPVVLKTVSKLNFNLLSRQMVRTYIRMWQKIQTIPNYDGPQKPAETFESFSSLEKHFEDTSLRMHFEKAFNGSQYFKTNLRSKLNHHLDYVLIYKCKDGEEPTPQVIDQNVNYIEDLNLPVDCKAVAIVFLPPKFFCRNTKQMLGGISASYDYIRSLSCKIIGVPQNKIWTTAELETYLKKVTKHQLEESKDA